MNRTVKIWLVIATVCILLGGILFTCVMASLDWNFGKFSTVSYVTNTYEVKEPFDAISIHVDTTQITFVPSKTDTCSIVCYELEKVQHAASVQNGTLIIQTVDTRRWYEHIGIFLGTPKMTVHLPQQVYASLSIETDTGDITIPKDFSFETLTIDGDTSDVDCFATVTGAMEIELSTGDIRVDTLTAGKVCLATDTGDILLHGVAVTNQIEIETDTGSITLTDVTCGDLTAESDTGSIVFNQVVASGSFSLESETGNIKFESSDAVQIFVRTSTGNVTGTLLSDKVFLTESDTGSISVPQTTSGGRCEITTATGDIKIVIDP